MADAGAAVVVPDAAVDGERLRREAEAIAQDPGTLAKMAEAARGLARPDAADRIAEGILALARTNSQK
jgi:UDP-N-acetylglucosamine--N-acetylmuramyl-(pentapeptide) pyrophosphoryl-undecaprenol N-acetylglucosamine transferase